MPEIEDAFRTLDLDPGASLKEVVEARDDMLTLWNPERLSNSPRLRSRAPEKVREIHEAYETLMKRLGESGAPRPASGSVADGSASLYDEVFSKGKRPSVPLWLIVVLTALVVVAALYFSQFATQSSQEEAPPAIESPTEAPAPTPSGPSEGDSAQVPSTETPAGVEPSPISVPDHAAPTRASVASPIPASPPKSRTPSEATPKQGPKPLLKHREIGTPQAQEDAELQAAQAEQERQRAIAEKAFQNLLANSGPARSLVEGQLWDLHLDHWQVVQQTDSEVWIDLVALRGDGKPVHHIWAVRVADGQPRPLSEAARDLESVKAGAENGG